jgi:hypothetical protein
MRSPVFVTFGPKPANDPRFPLHFPLSSTPPRHTTSLSPTLASKRCFSDARLLTEIFSFLSTSSRSSLVKLSYVVRFATPNGFLRELRLRRQRQRHRHTGSKMGLLSKFEKKVPSTADDPAAITTAAHLNYPEKTEVAQLESGHESPSAGNGFHVTAEMERRVVRKLDKRLVPLVMGLCMFSREREREGKRGINADDVNGE